MRIDILTAFPNVFMGPFRESIVGRACKRDLVDIFVHSLRAFTTDRHKTIDDYAYGGFPGMVLKPEPIFRGVRHVREQLDQSARSATILLSASGKPFVQETAKTFLELDQLILICGHYKGVDERVVMGLDSKEYSVGEFVVTGGEMPAMMIADSVIRLIPGALGEINSATTDSYFDGLLGNAVYTRPENYKGWQVPEILLSGNHLKIKKWQRQDALMKTFHERPDLLKNIKLTGEDQTFLKTLKQSENG